MVNYYSVLKVSQSASTDDLKNAINRELRLWSNRTNAPQIERRQEAERMVKILEEAESILLDENKRSEYNRKLTTAPSEERKIDDQDIAGKEDLVKEGWRLLIDDNVPDALYVATKATEKDASNPEAWALLAQAKFKWGETEDAIYEYKRAIKLKPNEAEYYFDLGAVYESAERWKEAFENYQRAANINPSATFYRAAMGIVYVKLDMNDEAIKILRQCTNEEPENKTYKWFLAIALSESMLSYFWKNQEDGLYYITDKKMMEEGKQRIEEALSYEFDDPELLSHLQEKKKWIDDSLKRKFSGSWLLVILWAIVYVVPGALMYLACLRPRYKFARDIKLLIEQNKGDKKFVAGEVGQYYGALPPGTKWMAHTLPRFVVWAIILLLSPITFFYNIYDNWISE